MPFPGLNLVAVKVLDIVNMWRDMRKSLNVRERSEEEETLTEFEKRHHK